MTVNDLVLELGLVRKNIDGFPYKAKFTCTRCSQAIILGTDSTTGELLNLSDDLKHLQEHKELHNTQLKSK
jgi:hypothetical protein